MGSEPLSEERGAWTRVVDLALYAFDQASCDTIHANNHSAYRAAFERHATALLTPWANAEREARQRAETQAQGALAREAEAWRRESAAMAACAKAERERKDGIVDAWEQCGKRIARGNALCEEQCDAARAAALSEAAEKLEPALSAGSHVRAVLGHCQAAILALTTPDALARHREREARRDAVIEAALATGADVLGTLDGDLSRAVSALDEAAR